MTFRRDFLAMTAGAVAARTVLPMAAGAKGSAQLADPSPDAELLRLGRLLDEAIVTENAAWAAVLPGEADDGPNMACARDLSAQTSDLVDLIIPISAVTAAGVLVKVRAFNWCRTWEPFDPMEFTHPQATTATTDVVLLASLLTDLTAMRSVGA